MENKIKIGLLYVMLMILLLPAANHKLKIIDSGKLKGGYRDAADSAISVSGWFSGSYQRNKERHFNDFTGFRADLVRLNNEIDFTLFDICHAGWTIKGKNGFLFQYPYINAYYGKDYSGYQQIREKAIKLKAIQDTLSRLGKTLILAYLPSKASYYPEYFPDDRVEEKRGVTNYESYRHVCDSLGINQVDMEAWFLSMKNKSSEPLFSKQGIHWSYYGALLAGDSLVRYIEHMRNVRIKHPIWTRVEHTDRLRYLDDDIAQELNLIFPYTRETMAYPVLQDVQDTGNKKINAVYIGDSYAFKMIAFSICKMNAHCEFWRYFDEINDINGHKVTYINGYDWKAAIDNTDCVVLAYTVYNFWQLGSGFIEQAYDRYYPQGTKSKESAY